MFDTSPLYLSADGLKKVAAQQLEEDFTFIVGKKNYTCNSYFAEFFSPLIARMRAEDSTINTFTIDIPDPDDYFNLVIQLMQGFEVDANVQESIFLRKVGSLLENTEMMEAFSFVNTTRLTNQNVVSTFEEKMELGRDTRKEIQYIASHFYSLKKESLFDLSLDTLKKLFSHPDLKIESENSLYSFITELISKRGPEFKQLLSYVQYQSLTNDLISNLSTYVNPQDFTEIPGLWEAIVKRITCQHKPLRLKHRYIHHDISIPFNGEPFKGIFTYITEHVTNGKNPIEEGVIEVSVSREECQVSPANLIKYSSPASKWYLVEQEDSWVCFDFKNARVAINAYTMCSGTDSSYWDYPVSYTWEGSEDKKVWVDIDSKDENSEMGGNDKTHTWVIPTLSQMFRYVRFRLRNVTRRGGLYTPMIELFGAYEPPSKLN
ncbi:hypothetical protein TVAG_141920 [Trichomonas vaginalis G3]|uniref:F5/8 type C domain-containing protein n=1 Tax=Trichomonas vaginalis (strain ATCC PRA-98 / G3) TaxID=412133 RepID=A2FWQ5_TRIV3|nr:protein ubiquitination [Trichomonas vaginalis G3]EAX90648.1 hypothetical protein TVAG_141920 [Trichomonas vaginalis G3]KAI5553836.1 protein ubiquitination [Trichomonas vaginalis G3]|eukprot:XP_001303578.1 hypothetical protein [Trichomonas vaginalis G3]